MDPDTLEIFYVGKSSNGLTRADKHRTEYALTKTENSDTRARIDAIHSRGKTYVSILLEEVVDPKDCTLPGYWNQRVINQTNINILEIWWIALGRSMGWSLTNRTDGGGGCAGRKHSTETKLKISNAQQGDKNWWRGRKHTDEAKAKVSASKLGVKRSDEARRKMSVSHTGLKASDETKALLSSLKKGPLHPMYGKKASAESRRKQSIARTGKQHSIETKARMQTAQIARRKREAEAKTCSIV